MRALVQRVTAGAVRIDGETVGRIDHGLVILLGIHRDDTVDDVHFVADKCVNLRIFRDAAGKFNRSLLDVRGAALVVSQFTLYGDCRRGRRPSFSTAAAPGIAMPLYARFISRLDALGIATASGKFGADMQVEIHNDGPVTVLVESKNG